MAKFIIDKRIPDYRRVMCFSGFKLIFQQIMSPSDHLNISRLCRLHSTYSPLFELEDGVLDFDNILEPDGLDIRFIDIGFKNHILFQVSFMGFCIQRLFTEENIFGEVCDPVSGFLKFVCCELLYRISRHDDLLL